MASILDGAKTASTLCLGAALLAVGYARAANPPEPAPVAVPPAPAPASSGAAPAETPAPPEKQGAESKAPAAASASAAVPTPPPPTGGVPPPMERSFSVPIVGSGHKPFESYYFLAGVSFAWPEGHNNAFRGTAIEAEVSAVPPWLISNSMAWMGIYGSYGHHTGVAKGAKGGRRGGVGLELGWRFLALDAGYAYDAAATGEKHGFRGRLGPVLSMEVFTTPKYRVSCCKVVTSEASDTACECSRGAWGLSLFPYWAVEWHAADTGAWDGMFGLSFKLATGQPFCQ